MSLFQDIPLGKLSVWAGNVRRTGAEAGLDELAASIAAHGLLNPLTVRKAAKGRFEVVAGQRRLLALLRLAADGTLPKAHPVPCSMIEAGQDGGELSLAENVVRVAMHPADQFEAWRDLLDRGAGVEDVATRFGVAASTVRKRLALGRVSPALLARYRDGDLSLEMLQAFTLTDDHARQDAVWDGLAHWQRDNPGSIRQKLTEAEVPTGDRRVRLVGLDAYEAAGGAVRRDLFAEEGGGTCQDPALLDRLVREKLEAIAASLRAEGWAWAETRDGFGWTERREFIEAEPAFDENETDEDGEPVELWSPEVKAMAGAIVTLGHEGPWIWRGLIRRQDVPEDGGGDEEDDRPAPQPDAAPPVKAGLPAFLIEDLTAHRTAALQAMLARSPDAALALVVYTLAAAQFAHAPASVLGLHLRTRRLWGSLGDDVAAVADLDATRERLGDRLSGDAAALWDWCFAASRDELLDVLAVAVASGLDAVVTKAEPNGRGVAEGDALARVLGLDMAQWWQPTAAGYFGRVPKAVILSDLEAAGRGNAPSWAKLPKADLAALAEREIAGTGWLPSPLK